MATYIVKNNARFISTATYGIDVRIPIVTALEFIYYVKYDIVSILNVKERINTYMVEPITVRLDSVDSRRRAILTLLGYISGRLYSIADQINQVKVPYKLDKISEKLAYDLEKLNTKLNNDLEKINTKLNNDLEKINTKLNNDVEKISGRLDTIEPEIVYIETKAPTRVISIVPVIDTTHVDWIETIVHIVPDPIVICRPDSSDTTGLTTSSISEDGYLLTDSREADTVSLITEESYLLTFGDSNWSEQDLDPHTHEEYEYVPHYERHILTFTRANGQ